MKNVKNRLSCAVATALTTLLMNPMQAAESNRPRVSIVTLGTIENVDRRFGFGHFVSYAGGILYTFAETFGVQFAIQKGNAEREFDLIGSTGRLKVDILKYHLQLQYLLFRVGNIVDIAPSVGVGLIHFRSHAMEISLGATGTTRIPERSEDHVLALFGIQLSKRIASRIAVEIRPQLYVLSPFSTIRTSYLLAGGLAIDIL